MRKLMISLTVLSLAACNTPKIDEPRIEFPLPPPVLMEPPKELETIKQPETDTLDRR